MRYWFLWRGSFYQSRSREQEIPTEKMLNSHRFSIRKKFFFPAYFHCGNFNVFNENFYALAFVGWSLGWV